MVERLHKVINEFEKYSVTDTAAIMDYKTFLEILTKTIPVFLFPSRNTNAFN
jgi:hypothetical protein